MDELIHQGYRDALVEGIKPRRKAEFGEIPPIYFPLDYRKTLTAVTVVSLLWALVLALFFVPKERTGASEPVQSFELEQKNSRSTDEEVVKDLEQLKNDVALMKDIISGLFQSVSSLSSTRKAAELPYPVLVAKNKTPIFSEPSDDQKPLLELEMNSALLVTEKTNGFLKITSPKGEVSWIREKDVSVNREK